MSRFVPPFAAASILLSTFVCGSLASADDFADESPRRTALVRVVERTLPAVVAIRTVERGEGNIRVNFGSGAIIHPDGFILTNNHVIQSASAGDVLLSDDRVIPFRLVVRYPPDDLAVLKIDANSPLPTTQLGRSHDLMLGEPTVVIGTPNGLTRSVSTGIVSGLSRSTRTENAFLSSVVQTTAATSGGNSGGPLLNALGQQIGVMASRDLTGQNISFAIMVDHVRTVFPSMISAEPRFGFVLGVRVDMLEDEARIVEVKPASPAEEAGLLVGDIVTQINESSIRHGVDFHLSLIDRKPGDALVIHFRRGDEAANVRVTLAPLRPRESVVIDGEQSGLNVAVFSGQWTKLPDFDQLQPVHRQIVKQIGLSELNQWQDQFGLKLTGYVYVPSSGLYAFYLRSDDGSRLWIGDQLVVDNDENHPSKDVGGYVRLEAGLHPITVTYFEGSGAQELKMFVEGPGTPYAEVPADWLFHSPE